MKWVLWLALVGLVSKADTRSINYEYENEQGLDSEQKGIAGAVTGKYETLDHNGEIVKVKYIADHMGFRLIDELEVTDKDINSPNAEPEVEPTESMTQAAEQTTNKPIDNSVKLTEREIESTTQTTTEADEDEGEEEEESDEEEPEAEETEVEDTEAEESEAEAEAGNEVENTEATITEEEIESDSVITEEKTHPTDSEIDSEAKVSQKEDENEPTVEGESMNIEEFENNDIAISERKGEASEKNEVASEPKSISVTKTLDSTVETVIPVAMKIEVKSENDNKQEEIVTKKSGEFSDSKSTNIEITAEPIENYVETPAKTSSLSSNMIIKQEVITERIEPMSQINTEISDKNTIKIEQETLQSSPSAKSILSVRNIDNALIKDDLKYQLTEILQVPTKYFSYEPVSNLPKPLQLVDVITSNSNVLEIEQEVLEKSLNSKTGLSVQSQKQQSIPDEPFVYYDNKSPDASKIIIKEIDQEINVTPKRMVTLSSKQLNNVNPGAVLIEKTSISETQSDPEVVIVRKGESGVLTIETQHIDEEIAIEPLHRRSSMKIESELADEKDFINGEETNIVVREILPSKETVQSQFLEAQVKIKTNEAKSLVAVPNSPETSKITLELPPITVEKSLAESMPKMPIKQEMKIETEVIEDISLPMAFTQPKLSKITLELPSITLEKSLAESMPKMPIEHEMEIETEVIEDISLPIEEISLPMAFTQPEVSKTHVFKKLTESKTPKQFVRSAPKPVPVLLQQTIPIQSLKKPSIAIQRISQQPTPKEVRLIEVRGAPKPTTIVHINPDAEVRILESDQVLYNKNTKITTEVITEDDISSEIKSFKVRDFVRY